MAPAGRSEKPGGLAEHAARPVGVCVLAGNKRGQQFYERRGARRIGERVAFQLDEEPIVDILYRFDAATAPPLVSNTC
jgi:hypothetical protein